MAGPPGSDKTLTARALPGILPPLTLEEALVVTHIYSVADALPPEMMVQPICTANRVSAVSFLALFVRGMAEISISLVVFGSAFVGATRRVAL